MTTPATWIGVLKRFNGPSADVRAHMKHFPKLAEDFPWDVSLAYVFSRVELAHNMSLYCGAVKLHRANAQLAKTAVQLHHLTRDGFDKMFETIYGTPIPPAITKPLEEAEDIRDRALHGKTTTAVEHRRALCRVFEYAEGFNNFVHTKSAFKPFSDLRGFKGRSKGLDKATTRWVLKGMGFALQ